MDSITTIGLDIAKNSFTVHAEDAEGRVVVKKDLKRKDVTAFFAKLSPQRCLVVRLVAPPTTGPARSPSSAMMSG